MRNLVIRNTLAVLVLVGTTLSPAWRANAASTATPAAAAAAYAGLPLAFEANHGQTDAGVRFLAHGNGFTAFLTPAEVVLALSPTPNVGAASDAGVAIRMRAAGMNPAARVEAVDPLPGKANYFVGSDPSRWQRDVPISARVAYRDVYPGIDLVFHGDRQGLEYDLVIAPGADPAAIALAFDGAERLAIEDRALVLHTALGVIRQPPPVCFQEVDGHRRPVEGRYELRDGQVRFALGDYDHGRQLVIDPVLAYATYLGGSGTDAATGIAVDPAHNIYVVGTTRSTDFPTPEGGPTRSRDDNDYFVARIRADGSALEYVAFVGSTDDERDPARIAVDRGGRATIVGTAEQGDFPLVRPLRGFAGGDAYVASFDASGGLRFATFLGGSSFEGGSGVAVDEAGIVYVTGGTSSFDFPVRDALQPQRNGDFDAFVVKLDPALGGSAALLYGTYIGGRFGSSSGAAIAIDGAHAIYLAGSTDCSDFPTMNAYQPALRGSDDAFVTKLDPTGSTILSSTFVGGSAGDFSTAVAVDASGAIYVGGETFSSDYPTTPGAFQSTKGQGGGFLTKLAPGVGDRSSTRRTSRPRACGWRWEMWRSVPMASRTSSARSRAIPWGRHPTSRS